MQGVYFFPRWWKISALIAVACLSCVRAAPTLSSTCWLDANGSAIVASGQPVKLSACAGGQEDSSLTMALDANTAVSAIRAEFVGDLVTGDALSLGTFTDAGISVSTTFGNGGIEVTSSTTEAHLGVDVTSTELPFRVLNAVSYTTTNASTASREVKVTFVACTVDNTDNAICAAGGTPTESLPLTFLVVVPGTEPTITVPSGDLVFVGDRTRVVPTEEASTFAVADTDSATLLGATVQISERCDNRQRETITIAGTWAVDDTVQVSVDITAPSAQNLSVTYTVASTDNNAIATGLASALENNAEVAALMENITASTNTVPLVASAAATLFTVTVTPDSTNGTATATSQGRMADELTVDDAVLGTLLDNDEERLITAAYDQDTCMLTLKGEASVANYETALEAVQLVVHNAVATGSPPTWAPVIGPGEYLRTIYIKVTDSTAVNSAVDSRAIWASSFIPAPTVSLVTPDTAVTRGTVLTIEGANFGPKGPFFKETLGAQTAGDPCDPYNDDGIRDENCIFPTLVGDTIRGCVEQPCPDVLGHLVALVLVGANTKARCTDVKVIDDGTSVGATATLTCKAPAGSGTGNVVTVEIQHDDGQSSVEKSGSGGGVGYAAPEVVRVEGLARTCGDSCDAHCATGDNLITILGRNFGYATSEAINVSVATLGDCSAAPATPMVIDTFANSPDCGIGGCPVGLVDGSDVELEAITCVPPMGSGRDHDVTVTVSDQKGQEAVDVLNYAPPVVKSIKKKDDSCGTGTTLQTEGCRLNYLGGDSFIIEGDNFGDENVGVAVQFGEIVMTVSEVSHCQVQGLAVAADDDELGPTVSVQVDGQTSVFTPPVDLYEGPAVDSVARSGWIYGDQFGYGVNGFVPSSSFVYETEPTDLTDIEGAWITIKGRNFLASGETVKPFVADDNDVVTDAVYFDGIEVKFGNKSRDAYIKDANTILTRHSDAIDGSTTIDGEPLTLSACQALGMTPKSGTTTVTLKLGGTVSTNANADGSPAAGAEKNFTYLGPFISSIVSTDDPATTDVEGVYTEGGKITITGKRFGPAADDGTTCATSGGTRFFNTADYPLAEVSLCLSTDCASKVACVNPTVTTSTAVECELQPWGTTSSPRGMPFGDGRSSAPALSLDAAMDGRIKMVVGRVQDNVAATERGTHGGDPESFDGGGTGAGKFQVSPPVVSSATATITNGVATVTVTGNNFGGGNGEAITGDNKEQFFVRDVMVGGEQCDDIRVTTNTVSPSDKNATLECTPKMLFGLGHDVVVKVGRPSDEEGDWLPSNTGTVDFPTEIIGASTVAGDGLLPGKVGTDGFTVLTIRGSNFGAAASQVLVTLQIGDVNVQCNASRESSCGGTLCGIAKDVDLSGLGTHDVVRCKVAEGNTRETAKGIKLKVVFCAMDSNAANCSRELGDANPDIPAAWSTTDGFLDSPTIAFSPPTVTSIAVDSATNGGWVTVNTLTIRGTELWPNGLTVSVQKLHSVETLQCGSPTVCDSVVDGKCITCTYDCSGLTDGTGSVPCVPNEDRSVTVTVTDQTSSAFTWSGGVPGPYINSVSKVYVFGGEIAISGQGFTGGTVDAVQYCDATTFANCEDGGSTNAPWETAMSHAGTGPITASVPEHIRTAGDGSDALTVRVNFTYSVPKCTAWGTDLDCTDTEASAQHPTSTDATADAAGTNGQAMLEYVAPTIRTSKSTGFAVDESDEQIKVPTISGTLAGADCLATFVLNWDSDLGIPSPAVEPSELRYYPDETQAPDLSATLTANKSSTSPPYELWEVCIPDGVGHFLLDLGFSCGDGTCYTEKAKFARAAPSITAIAIADSPTPANVSASTTMTVIGMNFSTADTDLDFVRGHLNVSLVAGDEGKVIYKGTISSIVWNDVSEKFTLTVSLPEATGTVSKIRMTSKCTECTTSIIGEDYTAFTLVYPQPAITGIYTTLSDGTQGRPSTLPERTTINGLVGTWITIAGNFGPALTVSEAADRALGVKFGASSTGCIRPFINDSGHIVCSVACIGEEDSCLPPGRISGSGGDFSPSFTLDGEDWTVTNDLPYTLSYAAPIVSSVTDAAEGSGGTSVGVFGGSLTIRGENFGETDAARNFMPPVAAVRTVEFSYMQRDGVTSQTHSCTVSDHSSIEFPQGEEVPASHSIIVCSAGPFLNLPLTGAEVTVKVSVGPDDGTGALDDAYDLSGSLSFMLRRPRITGIDPQPPFFGGRITISGTDFGPAGTSYITGVRIGGISVSDINVYAPQVVEDAETGDVHIEMYIPQRTTGNKLYENTSLELVINGALTEIAEPDSTAVPHPQKLTTAHPRITALTPVPTDGSNKLTVKGLGFPPAKASAYDVSSLLTIDIVDSDSSDPPTPCSQPERVGVTDVDDIANGIGWLACSIAPGTGGGKYVQLTVSGTPDMTVDSQELAEGNLVYAKPSIGSVEPVNGIVPGNITIAGNNFYIDTDLIEVTVGGSACQLLDTGAILENHERVTCSIVASSDTIGSDIDVVITIDGVPSDPFTVSAAKPVIDSVDGKSYSVAAGRAGGPITIAGAHFGPECTGGCDAWVLFGQNQVECTEVSVRDTDDDGYGDGDTIECTMPAMTTDNGFSADDLSGLSPMSFVVVIGPLDSSVESDPADLMIVAPKITGITSSAGGALPLPGSTSYIRNDLLPRVYVGTKITLTGEGFGPTSENLQITLTDVGNAANFVTVDQVDEMDDSKIVFTVPAVQGTEMKLDLAIFEQAAIVADVEEAANEGPRLYAGKPFVSPAQSGSTPTGGGTATITGFNFGSACDHSTEGPCDVKVVMQKVRNTAADPVTDVRECTDPSVTDTGEIQCTIGAGVGSGWDVFVGIGAGCEVAVTPVSEDDGSFSFSVGAGGACDVSDHKRADADAFIMDESPSGRAVWSYGPPQPTSVKFCSGDDAQREEEGSCGKIDYSAQEDSPVLVTHGFSADGSVPNKLYITGSNFGTSEETVGATKVRNTVRVWLTRGDNSGTGDDPDGGCTKTVDSLTETLKGVECTGATLVVDNTAIECVVPPNIGSAVNVIVEVEGRDHVARDSDETRVRYLPPNITSVSSETDPDPRGGTVITLSGNFGGLIPDDTVDDQTCYANRLQEGDVTITFATNGAETLYGTNTVPCGSATVVPADGATQTGITVTCVVPAGTGAGHSIQLVSGGEVGEQGTFSYQAPVITAVSSPSVSGTAQEITITGQNFGHGSSATKSIPVSVSIGYDTSNGDAAPEGDVLGTCSTPSLDESDPGEVDGIFLSTITCTLPSDGLGAGYTVTVAIDGNETAEPFPLAFVPPAISANMTLITLSDEVMTEKEPAGDRELSISPRFGNVQGETTITILGQNFRNKEDVRYLQVWFSPTTNTAEFGEKAFMATDDVFMEEHASPADQPEVYRIITKVPVGAGKDLYVFLRTCAGTCTNGQFSASSDRARFDFPPPVVTATSVVFTTIEDGQEVTQTLNNVASAEGDTLTVTGRNFGPAGTVVTELKIGTYPCVNADSTKPLVTVSDTTIVCELGKGHGIDLPIIVTILGSTSDTQYPHKMRFKCPVVSQVLTTGLGSASPSFSCTGISCTPGLSGQRVVVRVKELGLEREDEVNKITVKFLKPGMSNEDVRTLQSSSLYWISRGSVLDDSPVTIVEGTELPDADGNYHLSVAVPVGYGRALPLAVEIAGQDSLGMCGDEAPLEASAVNQLARFTYPKPEVLGVDSAPTRGGRVTIRGRNFGTSGNTDLQVVQTNYRGSQIFCSDPTIPLELVNVGIVCNMGAGEGSNNTLVVYRGPTSGDLGNQQLESDAFRRYSYQIPEIELMGISCYPPDPENDDKPDKTVTRSSNCEAGDWVFVSGTNFGNNHRETVLSIYDPKPPGEEEGAVGAPLVLAEAFPPEDCEAASGETCTHERVMFRMPAISGKQRSIRVRLLARTAAFASFSSASAFNALPVFFSYMAPEVDAVSSVGSEGGVVTISGRHFGVVTSSVHVAIGSQECTGASVTRGDPEWGDGVQIQCDLPTGAGGNKDVVVTVHKGASAEQVGRKDGAFSYSGPRVTRIDGIIEKVPGEDGAIDPNATGKPGDRLTIYGSSLGVTADDLVIRFVTADNSVRGVCDSVEVEEAHVRVACVAPQIQGLNLRIVAVVGGQASPLTGAPQFTFQVLGCKDPRADNYNPNATDEDGSCVITGCTDPKAINFIEAPPNGVVRDAEPSVCVMPPVKVSMRRDLNWDVFERGRERYIDLHINNLASNMGINRSRITFESARRGSVIFVTAIADVAPASRQPNEASAADAVAVLDSKIRTGSFEEVVEMPVLGVTYEGNGNTLAVEEGDEIRTEAGDDRISVWNYVAFGIAGVVILVAAAFSKQIYRALTKGRSKTPGSSDGRRSRAKTRHYPGDLEAAKDAPGSSRPSANALPEPERPSSKQIRVAPAPVVVSGGETAQPRPNLGGPIGMAGGMVRVEQSASANVGRGGQRGRTAGGAREGPRAPRNEANNRNVYAAGPMLL